MSLPAQFEEDCDHRLRCGKFARRNQPRWRACLGPHGRHHVGSNSSRLLYANVCLDDGGPCWIEAYAIGSLLARTALGDSTLLTD